MNKKTFSLLIIISAILLICVFMFVSLIFEPNLSLSDFDSLEEYNQMNMAKNVLWMVIIPFGCPFLILLPIILYYTKKISKKPTIMNEKN